MENKANLAKAIIAVMQEVKGIEKSMTIGSGNSAYKGVPDQEVKKIIGESMAKNGLCILPIGVEPKIQIDRWEETAYDNYQKKEVTKQKQSVFTEVITKYLLLHSSGESIELSGYGHGIDSQDKGAGKSTTYALKYTMLYTFLVPTGKIDDADMVHSDSIQTPKPTLTEQVETAKAKIITATTLEDLKAKWSTLNKIEQAFQEVIELKDKLKTTLK
jgi:hypothetical protein